MLPVTRANLDHICCICLLDVRPSPTTQKVYDVRKDFNMSKILKLTAHITLLKNPMNQKYVNDYCRKICETCFIKIQYSYSFREKIVASTTALKELLENNNLNESEIEKLNFFCRICLNRQKSSKDFKNLDMFHLKSLKDCSGIRFTSLLDKETFRIKEGTNISEIAVINDTNFPQQLCRYCLQKLKNVDEFRKSATQSFEYMISVMCDIVTTEDQLNIHQINSYKQNMYWKKVTESGSPIVDCKNKSEPILKTNKVKDEREQETSCTDIIRNLKYICDVEPVVNVEDENIQRFDYESFDNSDDSNNESAVYNQNNFLKKNWIKSSEQNHSNKISFKIEENNIESENVTRNEQNHSTEAKKLSHYPQKRKKSARKQKEIDERPQKKISELSYVKNDNVDNSNETFTCEDCLKDFSSRVSLKKHKKTVHKFDSTKLLECMFCFKIFKRKSHFTDHIKAVHEKLKPFKCSFCEKTFSAKNSKRVHELSHTGDFPFVCNFCGKGFRRANQLKIHLDIHTTNPELLCPICKRNQKSEADMEDHLKTHNDKRLQCTLCGKLFTRNFHLKNHHNAVHLKLRPFKCEFCELAFGDRKTRRTHEKLHTENRPVKCSICKMGFNTTYGFNKHIKDFGHKLENYECTSKTKKNKSSVSILN